MNEQSTDPGNTQIVLPIICSHCGKEVNLAVDFTLLPPDMPIPVVLPAQKKDEPEEEEA